MTTIEELIALIKQRVRLIDKSESNHIQKIVLLCNSYDKKSINEKTFIKEFAFHYLDYKMHRSMYGLKTHYDQYVFDLLNSETRQHEILDNLIFKFLTDLSDKEIGKLFEYFEKYTDYISIYMYNKDLCIALCKFVELNHTLFGHLNIKRLQKQLEDIRTIDMLALVDIEAALSKTMVKLNQANADSSLQIRAQTEEVLVEKLNSSADIADIITFLSEMDKKHGCVFTSSIIPIIAGTNATNTLKTQVYFAIFCFQSPRDLIKDQKSLPVFIDSESIHATLSVDDIVKKLDETDLQELHVLFAYQDSNEKTLLQLMLESSAPDGLKKRFYLLHAKTGTINFVEKVCRPFLSSPEGKLTTWYLSRLINGEDIYTPFKKEVLKEGKAYQILKALAQAIPYYRFPHLEPQLILHQFLSFKPEIADGCISDFNENFNKASASFKDKINALVQLSDALRTNNQGVPETALAQVILKPRGPIRLTETKLDSLFKKSLDILFDNERTELDAWVQENMCVDRAYLIVKTYSMKTGTASLVQMSKPKEDHPNQNERELMAMVPKQ